MERIDAERPRALPRDALGQSGKAAEIADAPVARRAQAVELNRDTPGIRVVETGQVAAPRRHDEHGLGMAPAERDGEPMISERQRRIERQAEPPPLALACPVLREHRQRLERCDALAMIAVFERERPGESS